MGFVLFIIILRAMSSRINTVARVIGVMLLLMTIGMGSNIRNIGVIFLTISISVRKGLNSGEISGCAFLCIGFGFNLRYV